MTQDTDIRAKGRALFLAAIMVLSVFAMTAAFAGSATAQAGNYDGDSLELDGELFWQGQEFTVHNLNDADIQIRDASDDSLVQERTVSGGEITIDTSGLDAGHYYLQGAGAESDAEWEVSVQDLDASFAASEIGVDGETELEVSSSRASFDITIEHDDLDVDAIFGSATHSVSDGSAEIDANFSGVDPGTYEFDISVDDTAAEAVAEITILEDPDGEVTFTDGVYEVNEGDVASITLDAEDVDEFNVTIGTAAVNYIAELQINDPDDDEVTIMFNTYEAGNGSAAFSVDGAASVNVSEDHDLAADAKLAPGDYELSATLGVTEVDVATLILQDRSTGDSVVGVAPGGTASDDIGDYFTERSDVAEGDQLIFAVEINGIFGYLDGDNLSDSGYMSFEATQTNPGVNQAPVTFDDSDDGVSYVADAAAGELAIIVELDDVDDVEAGHEYDVEFALDGPYDEESVDGSFSVVDRVVTIDTDDDGVVAMPNVEGAELSGTSTAAPGNELRNVRLRAGGDNPFLKTSSGVEIQEDGSWAAEFDMSDTNDGQEFGITVQMDGIDDVTADGVVVDEDAPVEVDWDFQLSNMEIEEVVEYDDNNPYVIGTGTVTNEGDEEHTVTVGVWSDFFEDFIEGTTQEVTLAPGESQDLEFVLDPETSSPDSEYDLAISTQSDRYDFTIEVVDRLPDEETPTPTPEPEDTPTPTPEPEDTPTPTEEPEDTPTETPEEEQPGFGLVVALIALIAAALLAVRRRA